MSTRTTHSQYRSGDRISERAARGAMAHFRAAASKSITSPAVPGSANPIVNDRLDNRRPATDRQILRRWAVADLIAGATWRRASA
jgi:hypothetical protein